MPRQTTFDGYMLDTYAPALHEAWQQWFTDLGLDLGRIPAAGWVEVHDDTRTITFPYYREPDSLEPTPYTITLDRDVPAFPDDGRRLDPALPRRPEARHSAR
jgi:hypothetical protein